MLFGTGHPIFYIFDADTYTADTANSSAIDTITFTDHFNTHVNNIPSNSEWITNRSAFGNHVLKTRFVADRFGIVITTQDPEFRGTRGQDLYHEFITRQSNPSKRSDLWRCVQLHNYTKDGYKIRCYSRHDQIGIVGADWSLVKCMVNGGADEIWNGSLSLNVIGEEDKDTFVPFSVYSLTKALILDGVDDYCSVVSHNIAKTHTIEFAVKKTGITNAFEVVIGDSTSITFVDSNNTLRYDLTGGNFVAATVTALGGSSVDIYHVVRSDTAITIYENSVSIGSGALSANNDFSYAYIGRNSGGNYLTGKIIPRIYNIALTAEQVKLQYNGGYWANPKPPITSMYAGWRFDEVDSDLFTTTEEYDYSGHSKTATLAGGAYRGDW